MNIVLEDRYCSMNWDGGSLAIHIMMPQDQQLVASIKGGTRGWKACIMGRLYIVALGDVAIPRSPEKPLSLRIEAWQTSSALESTPDASFLSPFVDEMERLLRDGEGRLAAIHRGRS